MINGTRRGRSKVWLENVDNCRQAKAKTNSRKHKGGSPKLACSVLRALSCQSDQRQASFKLNPVRDLTNGNNLMEKLIYFSSVMNTSNSGNVSREHP